MTVHFLDAMQKLTKAQFSPGMAQRLRLARKFYISAVREVLKQECRPGEYEDAFYDLKNITHDSLGDLIGAVEKVRGES